MTLTSSALSAYAVNVKEILHKPLIVGASVSAGFGTLSPGDRLARRYTSETNIINIARGGTPARDHSESLNSELIKGRTVILAMDFMFWDSVLPSTPASLAALKKLFDLSARHDIPVVIGDIPELLPGRQIQRRALNKAIYEACAAHSKCSVLKLDDLHRKVMRDRYLEVKGRRYTFKELLPDGLHLADIGGEYLADFIFQAPIFQSR